MGREGKMATTGLGSCYLNIRLTSPMLFFSDGSGTGERIAQPFDPGLTRFLPLHLEFAAR